MAVARDLNREQTGDTWRGRLGGRGSLARREARWGYALISPWVVGLLIFWIGPLLAAFYYSFTDYPISRPQPGSGWRTTGRSSPRTPSS
ncbi:MAG: hypothetical protein M3464_08050 [Chloroflexota bacterium]|nr:hypothetical protein [Chloroflexota bacterium]